jgi:hypothetical protein
VWVQLAASTPAPWSEVVQATEAAVAMGLVDLPANVVIDEDRAAGWMLIR